LLRSPFGNNCVQWGNDPLCEAQKAAQSAVFEAERAARQLDCERLKAQEVAECNARLEAEVLSCQAERDANQGTQQRGVSDLLLSASDRLAISLPDQIASNDAVGALVERSSYSPLEFIRIVLRQDEDFVPEYVEEEFFGYTVGEYIFVNDLEELESRPIRFWLKQIEVSRFFADYGVENFASVYSENASVFDNLIDQRIGEICIEYNCD